MGGSLFFPLAPETFNGQRPLPGFPFFLGPSEFLASHLSPLRWSLSFEAAEAMPPLTVRDAIERQAMTARSRCLELLLDDPTLSPAQLAALVGSNINTVRALTGTDEFRATLSEAISQKHHSKIAKVRDASLGNALVAFDALNRILGEDSLAPTSQQIEAARLSLDFTQKTTLAAVPTPTPAQGVPSQSLTVNVSLSQDDLLRAREKAAARAQALTVDVLPALPSPSSVGPSRQPQGGSSL